MRQDNTTAAADVGLLSGTQTGRADVLHATKADIRRHCGRESKFFFSAGARRVAIEID